MTGERRKDEPQQTEEDKKYNWTASGLSFSTFIIVNVLILCYGIPFWATVDFDKYHFYVGLASAIINTLGLVAVAKAFASGPAGPVSAVSSISNIILVIIEAFKKRQVPTIYQFIGLILGIAGSLVLVIPEQLVYLLSCGCCCKSGREETKDLSINEIREMTKVGEENVEHLVPKDGGEE